MSRHNTEAWNAIHSMCRLQELDEENLYQKSKLLLNIYRRVCWTTIGRADYVAEELCLYCGSDLDGALLYLEEFAPDVERERFEAKVANIKKYAGEKQLTNEMVLSFIKKVLITDGEHIEIQWNFSDVFLQYLKTE